MTDPVKTPYRSPLCPDHGRPMVKGANEWECVCHAHDPGDTACSEHVPGKVYNRRLHRCPVCRADANPPYKTEEP